jgi:Na+/proline symporter
VATTAYFKDVAMVVALVVILIGVLVLDKGTGFMAAVTDKMPNLLQIKPDRKPMESRGTSPASSSPAWVWEA